MPLVGPVLRIRSGLVIDPGGGSIAGRPGDRRKLPSIPLALAACWDGEVRVPRLLGDEGRDEVLGVLAHRAEASHTRRSAEPNARSPRTSSTAMTPPSRSASTDFSGERERITPPCNRVGEENAGAPPAPSRWPSQARHGSCAWFLRAFATTCESGSSSTGRSRRGGAITCAASRSAAGRVDGDGAASLARAPRRPTPWFPLQRGWRTFE